MQINSSTANDPYAAVQKDSGLNRVPKQVLGQDDFLKLITVQLASQDPLKPMEDTAFIAQMAQFTSLEQTTQLAREFASVRATGEMNSAGAMLGRQVTVVTTGGEAIKGLVSAIDSTASSPRLLIDGVLYPYSAVTKVELAPAPEPLPAA